MCPPAQGALGSRVSLGMATVEASKETGRGVLGRKVWKPCRALGVQCAERPSRWEASRETRPKVSLAGRAGNRARCWVPGTAPFHVPIQNDGGGRASSRAGPFDQRRAGSLQGNPSGVLGRPPGRFSRLASGQTSESVALMRTRLSQETVAL